MSAEARCECCDLPTYSCGKATEDRQRREQQTEREQLLRQPGWFPAEFPGICGGCGVFFEPDTPIRRNSRAGGWRAECCAAGAS